MGVNYNDANYSPSLNGYSGVKPFRFWCQKVLPLVYDDSLSYYELLNKVVDYLNKTIEDVANVEDNVSALNDSYNQLQTHVNEALGTFRDYINNYFDNLDVQDEIDAKLDEMASSGALNELIDPLIPGAVTAWLAENVNPVGSAVVVDNSLSVAGAAADAKVTGDLMLNQNATNAHNENLFEPFYGLNTNTPVDVTFTEESGAIINSNGKISVVNTSNYKHTKIMAYKLGAKINVSAYVTTSTSYPHYLFMCDIFGNIIQEYLQPGPYGGQHSLSNINVPANCAFIYLMSSVSGYLQISTFNYAKISDTLNSINNSLNSSANLKFLTPTPIIFDFENNKITFNSTANVVYNGLLKFSFNAGNIDIIDISTLPYNRINIYLDMDNRSFIFANEFSELPYCGYVIKPTNITQFYPCAFSVIGGTVAENITQTQREIDFEDNTINATEKIVITLQRNNKFLNFGFVTDTHYYPAGINSTKNMRLWANIGKRKFVNFLAHGGDMINRYVSGTSGNNVTVNEYYNRMEKAINDFNDVDIPILIARGNHDAAKSDAIYASYTQFYKMCVENFTGDIIKSEYLNTYYKDFDEYGIRVIIIDVNISDEFNGSVQDSVLNWVETTALNTDKKVVVISHARNTRNLTAILSSFVNNGGVLIAHIYGDAHADSYSNTNGFNEVGVSTAYDRVSEDEIDNYCVSIFTINTDNRTLYETRIGLGNSRTFSY